AQDDGPRSVFQHALVPFGTAAANRIMPAVLIEDIPSDPMISAVDRVARGTKERRELEIHRPQRAGIAGANHCAYCCDVFGRDARCHAARETVTDQLPAGEPDRAGRFTTARTAKLMLRRKEKHQWAATGASSRR